MGSDAAGLSIWQEGLEVPTWACPREGNPNEHFGTVLGIAATHKVALRGALLASKETLTHGMAQRALRVDGVVGVAFTGFGVVDKSSGSG